VPGGSINLTRFQRASKSSSQSTGSGGDDVIESGSPRFHDVRRNFVVRRDGPVDAEDHGLRFGGEMCFANRPLDAFDSHFGTVNYLGHKIGANYCFLSSSLRRFGGCFR